MLGVAAIIKAQGQSTQYNTITITTQSISSSWAITNLVNSGEPLLWSVSGGVTIAPAEYSGNTFPTFDLSSNTGTATITVSSTDGFIGLTEFLADSTSVGSTADDVRTIDVTAASNIIVFSCKGHLNLPSIDLSSLTSVQNLTIRSNTLITEYDISFNTALTQLYAYNCSLNTLDLSNNDNCTTVHIYNNNLSGAQIDQILIDLDNNGQFNGTLRIENNAGNPTEISYTAYQNLSVKNWNITIDAEPPAPYIPQAESPIIFNFKIKSTTGLENRIYFDSSEPIYNASIIGFTVSNRSLDSLNINSGQLTDHYFIVTSNYTHWDNGHIRYDGTGTVQDSQGNLVKAFTAEFITNNIPEPTVTGQEYYVSPSGSDSNNGISISNPFRTLSKALSEASAGNTIWLGPGDYGDMDISVSKSGTSTNPIKIIGYKNSPGDISSNYYDYNVSYNTGEMPSFTNAGGVDYCLAIYDSRYLIFKNMQFSGPKSGIKWADTAGSGYMDNIVFENINMVGSGMLLFKNTQTTNLHHIRVKNCVMQDSFNTLLVRGAGQNLIEGCKTYSTITSGSPDYLLGIGGSNSIIKDCHAEATVQPDSSVHAIYIRSASWSDMSHNLIVGNTAKNVFYGLDVRNQNTNATIVKRNTVIGAGASQTGGMCLNGAGNDNIFEQNYIQNVRQGIIIREDSEEGSDGIGNGTGNIFRNNIIDTVSEGAIYTTMGTTGTLVYDDFKFYNNTFHNCAYLHSEATYVQKTNWLFRNNIFNDITAEGFSGGTDNEFDMDYNVWFNSYTTGLGPNDINIDPLFVDESAGNFEPQADFDSIDAPKISLAEFDFNGEERADTTTIGAVKHSDETFSSGQKPVLYDFKIENSQPTRVYFDSSGNISGMTANNYQNFTISGKTISGQFINGTSTTGHYFTVTVPFTFWDNNTIRLESGDGMVYDFTMEHIVNNIVEPTSTTERYVTTVASGGGNGTTEGSAWTWAEALTNATAGMTVWVKAGDYGNQVRTFDKTATASNPIKFIGYKTTKGDISTNYYNYGVTWSTSEMPTFTSSATSSTSNIWLALHGENIIFRNIQLDGYYYGVRSDAGGSNKLKSVLFDRFNSKDGYVVGTSTGNTAIWITYNDDIARLRFNDCTFINHSMGSITIQETVDRVNGGGQHCLINNCRSYNDQTNTNARQDYHFTINGNNNIIKDSYLENFNSTSTNASSHGFTIKGAGLYTNQYNLIVDCEAVNAQENYALRNYGVDYNVIKRCIGGNNNTVTVDGSDSGGIWFWGGVNHNVVEDCIFNDCWVGIGMRQNVGEDGTPPSRDVGSNNTVRNCIFDNNKRAIYTSADTVSADWNDNYIYNNTFNNCDTFYELGTSNVVVTNFVWKNNMIIDVPILTLNGATLTGFTFDYNVFNNAWTTGIGANDINIDPLLNASYQPQASFISIDAPRLSGVNYDYNKSERAPITTIGAVKHASELNIPDQEYTPDYYVSVSGSDTNDGTSPLTPWQTIDKVNSTIAAALDQELVIAFRRQDSWDERIVFDQLTRTTPVILTSYGTGSKPILTTVKTQNLSWADQGGNVWLHTGLTHRVWDMEFDGSIALRGTSQGQLGTNVSISGTDLDSIVRFYCNTVNNDLYIYSTDNPSNHTIKFPDKGQTIYVGNTDFVTIHDINIQGGYYAAVGIYGASNVTVDNNDIGYLSANGIEVNDFLGIRTTNITISNNILDSLFTIDYSGTVDETEYHSADGIQVWDCSGGEIANNTVKNWGHSQIQLLADSQDKWIENIKVYGNTAIASDLAYAAGISTGLQARYNELFNNTTIDIPGHNSVNGYGNHYHDNVHTGHRTSPIKSWRNGFGIWIQQSNFYGWESEYGNNVVEHNVAVNCESGGIGVSGNNFGYDLGRNVFRNNIIENCGSQNSNYGIWIESPYNVDGNSDGQVFENNIVYSDQTTTTVYFYGTALTVAGFNTQTSRSVEIAGNIASDPLLNVDYTVAAGSPAINNGAPSMSSTDRFGNARPYGTTYPDIGLSESTTEQYVPDYYVASSGSDTNDGLTPSTPFATFDKAMQVVSAGDVIAFKGGDVWYGENNLFNKYGTADQKIILTSYGTGQATFTGSEDLISWSSVGQNLYTHNVAGKTIYHMTRGGSLIGNGRYPKVTNLYDPESSYMLIGQVISPTEFTVPDLIGSADITGAYVHGGAYDWEFYTREVVAFNSVTGQITIDSAFDVAVASGKKCFLTNHLSFCTQDGDWHYDPNIDTVYLYSDSTPSELRGVTSAEHGIVLQNCSHIIVDNLHVEGFEEVGIYASGGANVVDVTNCLVENVQRGILTFESSNFSAHGNTLNNTITNALYGVVSALDNVITNHALLNKLPPTGYFRPNCPCIISFTDNTVIERNRIIDVGYHGIFFYKANTIVRNNYVENPMLSMEDGGAIYCDGLDIGGSVVEYNICIANPQNSVTWAAQGLYVDQDGTGITVRNNVVKGFQFGIQLHCSNANTYSYNIIYNPVRHCLQTGDKTYSADVVDNIITYNEFYSDNPDHDVVYIYNNDTTNFDIGTLNYNKYFNPSRSDSFYIDTLGTVGGYTLNGWNTLSGEDANSIDDNNFTITNSQIIYNDTNEIITVSLQGVWEDVDGTTYVNSIFLAPFMGKILYQKA